MSVKVYIHYENDDAPAKTSKIEIPRSWMTKTVADIIGVFTKAYNSKNPEHAIVIENVHLQTSDGVKVFSDAVVDVTLGDYSDYYIKDGVHIRRDVNVKGDDSSLSGKLRCKNYGCGTITGGKRPSRSAASKADALVRDDTGLIRASKEGETDIVRALLERNTFINIKDNDGSTPLMWATNRRHTETVRVLLEHGADYNLQNELGYTASIIASIVGPAETARVLLEHGTDPNIKDKNGRTSLMYASSYHSHANIVRMLLEYGADVNLQDSFGWTSLMKASKERSLDTVRVLLEHDADPNILAKDGTTSLMVASCQKDYNFYRDTNRHTNIVRMLLEYGADVNLQDSFGTTSLMKASEGNNVSIDTVRVLLEHGADPNIKNNDGETSLILMAASYEDCIDFVRVLLEHGADPNVQNSDGETSIMRASLRGHIGKVRLLLEHGANAILRDKYDNSALTISAEGHRCVLGFIRTYCKNPAIESLIVKQIVWNRRKELIMMLVENGYLHSPSLKLHLSTVDAPLLRFENILGNERLVRLIVGYI